MECGRRIQALDPILRAGAVDWDGAGVGGPDPQCNGNPLTPGERGRTCGLGLELAAIVLAIRRLRRHRGAFA
jgi:hypothetical protein